MSEPMDEIISLRGLRFHYRDWPGPGADAVPLVLLHGFTGHARSWDALASSLSRHFRVLALDQRGHGESGWAPADAYGTSEMVADLAAFVDALSLERFVLLGLSMGGIVSIAYAGARPVELERLILVDIGPEIMAGGMKSIRDNVARSDVFDDPEEAFSRAREDNPVPPEAHHRYRVRHSLMRTEDGRWTYRYDPVLRDPRAKRERLSSDAGWKAVASIDVPTLLVRGANSDILAREVAARMIDELADGRLVEIPGSGHPVPLDKPEAFEQVVREHLGIG
jgi:pimeloyl-ACP methyl ester carboxylesterase